MRRSRERKLSACRRALVCLLCVSSAALLHGAGDEANADHAPALPLAAAQPGKRTASSAAGSETGGAAHASRTLPRRLALQDAFRRALAANKHIQVASVEADTARIRIVGAEGRFDPAVFAEAALSRDREPPSSVSADDADTQEASLSAGLRKRIVTGTDIELSASSDYVRDRTDTADPNPLYGAEVSLLLRQDLLRDFGLDINRTEILTSQNHWRIAEEELRARVILKLFEVEEAYWALYFALADLRVREQQLQGATELVEQAEARAKVGEVPPIEITRAQSGAAAQAVGMVNARNRIAKLRHRLLRLMGDFGDDSAETQLDLTDTPPEPDTPISLARAMAVARGRHPEIAQARIRVANARIQEEFARNQKLPKLQLFGEWRLAGLEDELGPGANVFEDEYADWQVGLLLEQPLPNRRARADHKAAQLELRRAELRLADLIETVTRELADALDDLRAARAKTDTSRRARELAADLCQAEERSFELGRSDSLNVLDAQAALASAERDETRARTECATALAALHRILGDFLEYRNIALIRAEGL